MTKRHKKSRKRVDPVSTTGREKHAEARSSVLFAVALAFTVMAVVLVVHWPAVSAEALSFDDTQYLTENPLVQNPSWHNAGRFLTEVLEPSTVAGYYQPLAMISLMLDHALGGRADNLAPFHRTSLALHALNTGLLVIFLFQLFGNAWTAALVGLLFGVHPMVVETLPWVGERKTLLAAFFALGCLALYVRSARSNGRVSYFVAILLYALALMSKPTAMPLAVMLVLLDVWPLQRLNKRALLQKAPFFVLAALSAVITFVSQGRTANLRTPDEVSTSPLRIPLTICHNILFYPFKMIWPSNLSSHYPFPSPMSLAHPMVLAGAIGTLVLTVVLIVSLRRTKAPAVGWLCFFVMILPTLGVIGFTGVIAANKYAYLPVVGLLIPLAYFLNRWWGGTPAGTKVPSRRWAIVALVILLAGLEARASRHESAYWADTITLHERMIALAPDATILRNNVSYFLLKAGDNERAMVHLSHALKIVPDYAEANHNMGIALSNLGRNDEALKYYERAMPYARFPSDVHYSMGLALNRMGDPRAALEHFRIASQGSRRPADVYYAWGIAHERLDDVDSAIQAYREALEYNPRMATAQARLGAALSGAGQLEKAAEHLSEAVRLDSDRAGVHTDLGIALKKMGRLDEALAQFDLASKIDPGYAPAIVNRGDVFAQRGDAARATSTFRLAVDVDPDYALGHLMLGVALDDSGETAEAVNSFQEALRCEPENVKALLRLGSALRKLKRTDEAMERFRAVVRIDPENVAAHHNLAFDLTGAGRYEEAVVEFRRAIELKPDDAQLHVSLGTVLERLKRFGEAVEEYQQAIRLDADLTSARDRLKLLEGNAGSSAAP